MIYSLGAAIALNILRFPTTKYQVRVFNLNHKNSLKISPTVLASEGTSGQRGLE